jgi:hypothetical protein
MLHLPKASAQLLTMFAQLSDSPAGICVLEAVLKAPEIPNVLLGRVVDSRCFITKRGKCRKEKEYN